MKCVVLLVCVTLGTVSAQRAFAKAFPSTPPRYQAAPPAPSAQRSYVARANTDERLAETLKYDSDIQPDGTFGYGIETSNGIKADAQGTPRNFGGNPPVVPVVISGNFRWPSPEGQVVELTYIADENGYRASGPAIPTPPPIPEEILQSLQSRGLI